MGAPTLWNMVSYSVKSVENIAKFLSFKDILLQPCLSTIVPWRINKSNDNWTCLLTLAFCIDAPLSCPLRI